VGRERIELLTYGLRVSYTYQLKIRPVDFVMGGGNRIVACNPYHRLIYIFSIFNVPTNVPADLLDAIGSLWTLRVLGA